jgi:hypothetical protein
MESAGPDGQSLHYASSAVFSDDMSGLGQWTATQVARVLQRL